VSLGAQGAIEELVRLAQQIVDVLPVSKALLSSPQ
jgi:hypothetical protein